MPAYPMSASGLTSAPALPPAGWPGTVYYMTPPTTVRLPLPTHPILNISTPHYSCSPPHPLLPQTPMVNGGHIDPIMAAHMSHLQVSNSYAAGHTPYVPAPFVPSAQYGGGWTLTHTPTVPYQVIKHAATITDDIEEIVTKMTSSHLGSEQISSPHYIVRRCLAHTIWSEDV